MLQRKRWGFQRNRLPITSPESIGMKIPLLSTEHNIHTSQAGAPSCQSNVDKTATQTQAQQAPKVNQHHLCPGPPKPDDYDETPGFWEQFGNRESVFTSLTTSLSSLRQSHVQEEEQMIESSGGITQTAVPAQDQTHIVPTQSRHYHE